MEVRVRGIYAGAASKRTLDVKIQKCLESFRRSKYFIDDFHGISRLGAPSPAATTQTKGIDMDYLSAGYRSILRKVGLGSRILLAQVILSPLEIA